MKSKEEEDIYKKGFKLSFVTGNIHKVNELQEMVPKDIEVEHIDYDYIEIQADELEDVASFGAKISSEHLKKAVIVEDSGIFIDSLNGFPGPYSSYVFKKIGNEGILKLMAGVDDRKATFKSIIGFYNPKIQKEPILFSGSVVGKISEEIKGKNGFGYDPIFCLNKKTFGEISLKEKNKLSHRKKSFEKLLNWILEEMDKLQ